MQFKNFIENLFHKRLNPTGRRFTPINRKSFRDLQILLDYFEENGDGPENYKNVIIIFEHIVHTMKLFLNQLRNTEEIQQGNPDAQRFLFLNARLESGTTNELDNLKLSQSNLAMKHRFELSFGNRNFTDRIEDANRRIYLDTKSKKLQNLEFEMIEFNNMFVLIVNRIRNIVKYWK